MFLQTSNIINLESMRIRLLQLCTKKLEKGKFGKLEGASIRIAINENGKVIDAEITTSSKDAIADQLIIKAFLSMPLWSPAKDADGIRVRQDLEFSIGRNLGC